MRCVEFTVMGQARPKGSSKAISRKGESKTLIVGANPKTKRWETAVAVMAFHARRGQPLFAGPVAVVVHFHLRRPKGLAKRVTAHTTKPDVDKLSRAVLDGLRGVLFGDDAQVVALHAFKSYALGEECTSISVTEGPYATQEVAQGEKSLIHAADPRVAH